MLASNNWHVLKCWGRVDVHLGTVLKKCIIWQLFRKIKSAAAFSSGTIMSYFFQKHTILVNSSKRFCHSLNGLIGGHLLAWQNLLRESKHLQTPLKGICLAFAVYCRHSMAARLFLVSPLNISQKTSGVDLFSWTVSVLCHRPECVACQRKRTQTRVNLTSKNRLKRRRDKKRSEKSVAFFFLTAVSRPITCSSLKGQTSLGLHAPLRWNKLWLTALLVQFIWSSVNVEIGMLVHAIRWYCAVSNVSYQN